MINTEITDLNSLVSAVENLYKVNETMLQYISTLKTVQDDAQTALSEEGEQTMAKQRTRIMIDKGDNGEPVLKQISIKGSTDWERNQEIFERIADSPLGRLKLQEMGLYCPQGNVYGSMSIKKNVPLFSEYATNWLKSNLSINANTKATYGKFLKFDINPFFGAKHLNEITIDDLLTFFTGMQEGNYSKATGNTCKTIIKQVLQCAVTDGLISINPALDPRVKNPCTKKTERNPLTEDEWRDVVHQIHDRLYSDDRLYMFLVAYTAARRGEVLALRYEDFDFDNLKLTISRNITFPDGYNANVGVPKGKKIGVVDIAKELAIELQECFKDCPKEGYLFHRDNDFEKPYTSSSFWEMWERIKNTIDLHGATSHVFRHTVATVLRDKGVDLETVSSILRHASVTTTADSYIKPNENKKKEAINLLSVNSMNAA